MIPERAMRAVRGAVEKAYIGRCWVSENQKVKDPATNKTESKWVEVLTDTPCYLSQKQLNASSQTETVNNVQYEIKLFLAPDYDLKSGSRVRVVQNGMDRDYVSAGEPHKYSTHQEVILLRSEKS
ncbi:hypothetical protein ACFSVM_25615 [Paenibacillus shunpengii]|uniref:Head-tail adaptor protein n=1 Tax=Paenibacillus shunpengii TaxID=2054424 RepID=A0ABW5SVK3_9BACL